MSLLGWIAALSGGLLYVVLWRFAFAAWYDDFKDVWGWGTLLTGLVVTFMVAVIDGPPVFFSRASIITSKRSRQNALWVGSLLAGEDRKDKMERQATRIKDLERENARLERELGIGVR